MQLLRRTLIVVTLPLLAGCYTYAPVQHSSVRVGTSVRANLSAGGAQRVERLLGPLDNQMLDGKVLESSPGKLTLETIYGHFENRAVDNAQMHSSIELTERDWLSLERGKVSVARTAGLAAAIGVAYKLVYRSVRALR